MNWDSIKIHRPKWDSRPADVRYVAKTHKPCLDWHPDSGVTAYIVELSKRGWIASYGYFAYALGGGQGPFHRQDIIGPFASAVDAMAAAEAHDAEQPPNAAQQGGDVSGEK